MLQAGNVVGSRLNVAKAQFLSFSPNFASILGQNPVVETLAERDTNFAHEGPVYLPDSNEVTMLVLYSLVVHSGNLYLGRSGI